MALGQNSRTVWVVAGLVALAAPAIAPIAATPQLKTQSEGVAQSASAPAFEVASIKLNPSNYPPLTAAHLKFLRVAGAGNARNGRFTMEGFGSTPLIVLIQLAYNIRDFQVSGGPSWVRSERYDVSARAEGAATFEQMRPMLRSLLADRFTLTLRRETRELPFYELVPSNDGLKITAMKEGGCVGPEQAKPLAPLNICGGIRIQFAPGRNVLEAVGISMATLMEQLSDAVDRVVVDKTGFTELFNVRLEFAPNLATDPSSAPSIFTALEEQLGIRMRSVTGPVEHFIIDEVKRPSEN